MKCMPMPPKRSSAALANQPGQSGCATPLPGSCVTGCAAKAPRVAMTRGSGAGASFFFVLPPSPAAGSRATARSQVSSASSADR